MDINKQFSKEALKACAESSMVRHGISIPKITIVTFHPRIKWDKEVNSIETFHDKKEIPVSI
jgi:hypothetical protein